MGVVRAGRGVPSHDCVVCHPQFKKKQGDGASRSLYSHALDARGEHDAILVGRRSSANMGVTADDGNAGGGGGGGGGAGAGAGAKGK